MARMNLDFSNVDSREALPEGVYEVTVAKAEDKISKAGNPMIKVEFNVVSEEYAGRKLWANYVLTDAAMWKVKELLDALGFDTSGPLDFDTTELIGLSCTAKVAQREYEGSVTNEVKWVK